MNPNKALGADSWKIAELRIPSPQLLHGLAGFSSLAEQVGKWHPELCVTLTALIPKEGAKTEGELRPVRLTPGIYRVWRCVRKQQIAHWSKALYGAWVLSPTHHAWNTRVGQEIARAQTKNATSGFRAKKPPNVPLAPDARDK